MDVGRGRVGWGVSARTHMHVLVCWFWKASWVIGWFRRALSEARKWGMWIPSEGAFQGERWAGTKVLRPEYTCTKTKLCKLWVCLMSIYSLHSCYSSAATAAAKSLRLCPTLYDPIDGSPPASPIPGILQAKTLKWVAISFSNAWKWQVKVKSLNRVWLLVTPWTAAYQAPLSMGPSRQKYLE